MSCAPTCMSIMSAGTRGWRTAAGCRPFRRRICVRRPGTGVLDREGTERPRQTAMDRGQRAADRRSRPAGSRDVSPRALGRREADPDAGPHDRPLLGAGRHAGRGRDHRRRHDPLADPGAISGVVHAGGLRSGPGRTNAARVVWGAVRHVDAAVHRALSVAVEGAADALGGRVPLHAGVNSDARIRPRSPPMTCPRCR